MVTDCRFRLVVQRANSGECERSLALERVGFAPKQIDKRRVCVALLFQTIASGEKMPVFKVHIEFQRVQTWLFAVPRLRAMIGANTLLGEVLRCELRKLAAPAGHGWCRATVDHAASFNAADPNDPLGDHDDPRLDAEVGILSRDGGHFEAQFTSEESARTFARAAGSLIRQQLNGLRFTIKVEHEVVMQADRALSNELPVLEPCNWTGRGLASDDVMQGSERSSVSLDVKHRHEAAKRAESGNANDLASLLFARSSMRDCARPQTFVDLVTRHGHPSQSHEHESRSYLALIHADGNGVGQSAGNKPSEHERSNAFHKNRVLLRRALKRAIDKVQEKYPANNSPTTVAPLVPLMLGGDDLLIVCHAELAFDFVIELCAELQRLQMKDTNELTLGIGIVFARHTVPIHRLHELTEQLAGSAKRLYRSQAKSTNVASESDAKGNSVVDWAVYSSSWLDDISEVRKRDWLYATRGSRRILSQRPLNVLGEGLNTLQGLVKASHHLECAPRSQFRFLVEQLSLGEELANLAFDELSPSAREALNKAGVNEVWQTRSATGAPCCCMTPLLDLVEVFEINKLGSQRSTGQASAHSETAQ